MKRTFIFATLALGVAAFGGLTVGTFPQLQAQTATTQTAAQTRIFVIENMTCALCPVTVQKAMARVPGVRLVRIDFEQKTATVSFDPSITTAEAIASASTNAGYPAKPKS